MAKKLKIKELGDRAIRKISKPVSLSYIKSKAFKDFARNLIKTCQMSDGVGIAAAQVGVGKKIFVVWMHPIKRYKNLPKTEPEIVINPKILFRSKKMIKDWEGCLSIPGIRGFVPRHKSIEVSYINKGGEKIKATFSDFHARIFQHEFDHLKGIVFLDRTKPKDLMTEKEYKKLIKK